jgi:protein-histidine pros-kinase
MKSDRVSSSAAFYEQVLETAPDAMVIVGADANIHYVNTQLERMFGYSRADLLGKGLEVLVPPRFRTSHAKQVGRFFQKPATRHMGSGLELFGAKADGTEFAIEVSLGPVHTAEGVFVSAAIRDITERKQLAEELRNARGAAEAASAAKSEFLASMSHELRTPLNAILGFAQLLLRDRKEPLSQRQKERADEVLKGGEHLLRLIDDILDLSCIEAGALSLSLGQVEVGELLREIKKTLEPMASRLTLTLGVELEHAPIVVVADRTRLCQILMNYGSNAIKYNRRSGTVTFSVEPIASDSARIRVTDTGVGIPLEKQGKLFQPFQRAGQENGSIEGTGIGLVITKRLAELMGGAVGFQSVPSTGSEFWVDVPLAAVTL